METPNVVGKERVRIVDSMYKDTLKGMPGIYWVPVRAEGCRRHAMFWRAVQDLIRDQLWQALNVSQRNLVLIQELKGSQ